jgi:predicted ArsR family transcriptional regulator
VSSDRGDHNRAVLRGAIRAFQQDGNTAPTLDELSAAVGFSKTNVRYHLRMMEERGTLKMGELRRELILIDPVESEAPHAC